MSSIAEAAIIWQLKQSTPVTAIVGNRIYPRLAPQGEEKPYLIVMRPPGQQTGHTNNAQIAVARTPIIVACVGDTYEQSRSPSDAISAALDPNDWTGSKFWNNTEVASCMQGETFDHSGMPQLADEIGFPVEFITFEIEHSTTTS
jgi:hypothetical protein